MIRTAHLKTGKAIATKKSVTPKSNVRIKRIRQGELELQELQTESNARQTAKAMKNFEKEIGTLSMQELRELALVNTYKLTLARNQLDAVVDILIKNKLTTYEEVWKRTNERFAHLNDLEKKE